ncbi:MAG: hypothetical protein HRU07_06580 [Nitrosopumilus sp.]|nr:hypothetical protein [Nitrosopumilus sp.]NRA05806.1 hypothetical protein [Nitrosopumilus sp.]
MTGVIPLEEIINNIKEMGYVTVEPKGEIKPSFYKLKDRTVLKVLININHLVADPRSPQGFTVNSNNTSICYVAKEDRHPEMYRPFTASEIQSNIDDEDMEPETLREDFSVYSLSNGMTLSVKAVVAQVSKTKFFTADGEPLYMVNTTPVIKVKKNP